MKGIRKVVLGGLLLILGFSAFGQKKPNIIFILADDHSYLSAGFNGSEVVKTPNLDNLAQQGMVFDNYYNTTAICMASRAQIMTGMMEYKTGCNFMHGSLTQQQFQKSYPVMLKNAGYQVAFAGKFGFPVTAEKSKDINHHSYDKLPVAEFHEWRGGIGQTEYETGKNEYIKEYAAEYPHSTRAYGAWASDYITEQVKSDEPFCLSISFKAPHIPNTPDPLFDEVYEGVTFPYPENYGPENGAHLAEQAKNGRQMMTLFTKYGYQPEDFQESVRNYYQLIYGVDYAVGMILDALKESGLDKNTVIIYTSDNGYHLGAHGFGGKVLPYEEAAKAPFIYFDPRNKNMDKQIRTNSLAGNIDVAPTILTLAGEDIPENMDGKSILPIINNPKTDIRPYLPVVNMWGTAPTQVLSIHTKDLKYIYWPYEGHLMQASEELFDKEHDALEMSNEVNNSKFKKELEKLRKYYDEEVAYIQKNGIDYNSYGFYKTFFDRSVSWDVKEKQLPNSFISNYEREVKKSEALHKKKMKK
ncbi:acetylglucosamine-6-sulfatase [Labilibacter sediminis]|nr:acetylglucosamine-6-sulfatase [Labilibacter sediminis]